MKTYITGRYNAPKRPFLAQIAAFLMLILCGISIEGCGTQKILPVEKVVYKEIVTTKTDTVSVEIPKEIIKEVVPQMDTLVMETSISKSISYLDTLTHALKGSLVNKPVRIDKEIEIQEKIVYRDSIVVQQVPVVEEKIVKHVPVFISVFASIGMSCTFLLLLYALSKMKAFKA